MQTLTENLIDRGMANRLLTETTLAWLLDGTPQRRHHLVNRAMKAGELVRVRRGHYVLANRYRTTLPNRFALAQAFVPGSYVSFETALSHHGWIPEAVYVTASVTPGRKSLSAEHPLFGNFEFRPLAIEVGCFLELVDYVRSAEQAMLVAKPIRALADLVCERKIPWQGIEWITEGMRIEEEDLAQVSREDLDLLIRIYKHKQVKTFLSSLAAALGL